MLTQSAAYATWQWPQSILNARFAKVVLQFDFQAAGAFLVMPGGRRGVYKGVCIFARRNPFIRGVTDAFSTR